jgi:phosphotransferase system HPr (HPr) family protein
MRISQVTVTHPVGLHARPAAAFVKLANQFNADIRVRNLTNPSDWANAKSILSLLVTGVRQNDRIEIQAEGTDESPAVEALEELVRSDFAQ